MEMQSCGFGGVRFGESGAGLVSGGGSRVEVGFGFGDGGGWGGWGGGRGVRGWGIGRGERSEERSRFLGFGFGLLGLGDRSLTVAARVTGGLEVFQFREGFLIGAFAERDPALQ